MNFCKNCDNVLTLKLEAVQDLGEETSKDDSCLFKIDYNLDNIKKNSFINPFIYDDITLPRANGIKCPNVDCTRANPDIVYINYDSANMKFIYICLDCYKEKREPHIW